MSRYELAFIGAGNMAEAIARGVIAAGVLAADKMIASDPAAVRREVFAAMKIATTADNAEAAASASHVLLAVKPQQMAAALATLAAVVSPDVPVISIAAGVSTAKIEQSLGNRAHRVVRVMPNTPMLVGAGMAALVKGAAATDADLAWARRLFDAGGRTLVVNDEELMDAVTAVSGSGPAYFFYLVENLVAAAVAEGLSNDDALLLAMQTYAGAAKLLIESKELPGELRRRVTSPGGTTQAACEVLDARGVPAAIRNAVRAAAERSRELGRDT